MTTQLSAADSINAVADIAGLEAGTTTDAGTLTGAELVPLGKVGLFQSTLTKIANFVLGQRDLVSYQALRTYTGLTTRVYVTGLLVTTQPSGIAGVFIVDPTDTTSLDDSGTIIVDNSGRRWKRQYVGALMAGWFGVTGDGVLCQIGFTAFEAALLKLGGIGMLPRGQINVGQWRALWTVANVPSNGFTLKGDGSTLVFKNISTVDPTTLREPTLFSCKGSSGTDYVTGVNLEDFDIDYSDQVCKGGATLASASLTDVIPYSDGTMVFEGDYLYKVRLKNININEVYGDGVRVLRCTAMHVENVNGINVSGGNPGISDSIGGFCFFAMSMACTAVKCTAWNFRTYQTHTTGAYITSDPYGTPCGYIGFWTEFALDTNAGTLPPFAELWLPGVSSAADIALALETASLQNVFEDCLAYGYTLGFKAEGTTLTRFTRCTSLYNWIPFLVTGSRGVARDCYANMLGLGAIEMPYAGYESTRGHYVGYNPGAPTIATYANGFVFDGCATFTNHSYPVFSTSMSFVKFLNQNTFIDCSTGGTPNPFFFPTNSPVYGVEIKGGEVYITGMTTNFGYNFTSAINPVFDLDIYNDSPQYALTLGLGTAGLRAKFRLFGLVVVSFSTSIDSNVEAQWTIPSTVVGTVAQLAYMDQYAARPRLKATFNVGSKVTTQALVTDNSLLSDLDVVANLTDAGSSTLSGVIQITSNGAQNVNVHRCIVTGDNYATPLMYASTIYGLTIGEMRSNSSTAPAISQFYGALCGPVRLRGPFNVAKLFAAAPGTEPNSIAGIYPYQYLNKGDKFPYLNPTAGGAEGIVILSDGLSCPAAWVSNTVLTAGGYYKTATGVYQYTAGGTSGTTAPTSTSIGVPVTDGAATAVYMGPLASVAPYGSISTPALQ